MFSANRAVTDRVCFAPTMASAPSDLHLQMRICLIRLCSVSSNTVGVNLLLNQCVQRFIHFLNYLRKVGNFTTILPKERSAPILVRRRL